MGAVSGVLGGAVGGVLGGIVGNEGQKSNSQNSNGVTLGAASSLENQGVAGTDAAYDNLKKIIAQGAGSQDYANGVASQRSLADLLGQYQKSGGLPTSDDINSANGITSNLYAARKTALDQSFTDQTTQANRLAAQLGRSVDDPILQAKLRTGFMKQSDSLSAEQQGTAQQLALQLPGQRLGYAQQQSSVLSGLGDQALQNQNYLLGIGQNLTSAERNWRLNTGTKWGTGNTQQGGGLAGSITGAVNGLGGGIGAGSSLSGLLGSSGGQAAASGALTAATGIPMSSGGFNLGVGGFGAAPSYAPSSLSSAFGSYSGGNTGFSLPQASKPSLGVDVSSMNPGFNPYASLSSPFSSPFSGGRF